MKRKFSVRNVRNLGSSRVVVIVLPAIFQMLFPIRHRKFREMETGIFGLMKMASCFKTHSFIVISLK